MAAGQSTATKTPQYYNGGTIRPLPDTKFGKQRWQVDYSSNYNRQKATRYSIEECKAWIDRAKKAVEQSGSDALLPTSLEMADAGNAREKAGGRVSLTNAVEFWIRHHPVTNEPSTVKAFYDRYYAELRDVKLCSPDHLKDVRRYCGKLVDRHGRLTLQEITPKHLQSIINGMKGVRDSTKRKARNSWRAMFNAAIDRKLIVGNPAKEILNDFTTRTPSRRQKLEKKHAIDILTPADTQKLFRQMESDRPELVSGLALSFFAGIRTEEISRVYWDMIDLEAAEIHLPAEVTKSTESRIIPLEQNAVEWLLNHPHPRLGRVLPGNADYPSKRRFEKGRRNTCKAADVIWKHNAARHSFGSYHSRLKGDEHQTFTAMGHSDIRTFRKHYRNTNISKAECEAFWNIRPERTTPSQ
jgi:site-specific recombinase XerC